MATKGDHVLVDTSAALALAQRENPLHRAARARLHACRRGMAGRSSCSPCSRGLRRHIASVPPRHFVRLAGAALYDGLVGAAARRHNLLLITCDHRAAPTYRALGVDYELLSPVSL